MIDRGATTVWERWNGVDGIPFESLPDRRIESAWRLGAGQFELSLTVPPGTTAEVALPDGSRRTAAPGRHTLRCPVP